MKRYGFALIGCGMIAEYHAKAIAQLPNAKLVAVSSRSADNARKVASPYGARIYTDYTELLRQQDVHVVNICTPSGAHLEPAVATAAAGKHVIVEKPLEITLERCDRIIEACRRAGVTLVTIFPSRFSDASQLLKKTVDSGRFGRFTLGDAYIKWWRPQSYYDSGGWRGTWQLDGGGALMNQSIHAIDLLQWLMGPVKSVVGFTDTLAHERIEVEDTAVAAVLFASGALGVIVGTTSAHPGMLKRIEISGTGGTVIMEEEEFRKWEFAQPAPDDEKIRAEFAHKLSSGGGASDPRAINYEYHRRQFADLLAALDRGGAPLIDGAEGRKAVEIILAVYRASQEGRRIDLPLKA